MVVVSYSMVVLTAVYTFQFQVVAGFFKETLKNGYTMWAWSHSTRLSCLLRSCCLLPAALPLACILQCHFFNEDFLKPTSLYNSPVKWKGTSDRLRPAGEEETCQRSQQFQLESGEIWKAGEEGVSRLEIPLPKRPCLSLLRAALQGCQESGAIQANG
ncbi:piezo-type mechanosensitive ion channel component 1-like isoform X1 [Phocoena sinus]|uniref:piezo-type mechanosensitive ion channel component 1-like isoform X1 n=1 Tax=Phocoena sinus TaxID=42100 RepID=UPI0013C4EC89|nr:piezo-type mechanosensitive ion channel component 1-like isoform X1 [Phocoena sinus]